MAKASYQEAINQNQVEFYGYWGLGNVFLRKEQYSKAWKYFMISSQLNPNCATIYTYLGITSNNMKQYDMALKYFQ